jgi:hypothetical protein
VRDAEALSVCAAVTQSLGGCVVGPAPRAAAVGDGGGRPIGGADADAHVVTQEIPAKRGCTFCNNFCGLIKSVSFMPKVAGVKVYTR